MHTDQRYIEALRKNDSVLLSEIYRKYAPSITAYLKSKGADTEECGDIFQESLIDIFKLAADGKFVLTCPFEAFLLLICKRKWINLLKKKSRSGVTKSLDDGYQYLKDNTDAEASAHAQQMEQEALVMELLEQLSERCREIIRASYLSDSQQKLAEQLGVSYAYLRKKKSICMSELIELVNHNRHQS
ncbi:sigma-70 family RNA polymerase sigma factor [Niabella pedocola]|uniref:Sigma-70 family RNA polymerase sigma factor n=1 Tax=Niabella pedocola TaxID=1752077 RepID=A0ABS8PU02_9BACT|nr:sigma-70 family RNA polymerase sigma factor [Niabella pedocola]MCD2424544.1 sigma-70 family RNA polymerase sigma factor [Niabella pedocola]